MLSRPSALVLLGSVLAVLAAACKERGQDTRPLPPPEPPASSAPLLPHDDVAATPKKRPSDEELAVKSKRPAVDVPAAAPAPEVAPAPEGSASPPTTAPTAPAASAPPLAAPSAACLSRCQGAMQGCLSAPVDGGVPGFSNLDLCKKAFEACQSACERP